MNINAGIRDTSGQDEVIVKKKDYRHLFKWLLGVVVVSLIILSIWGRLSSILAGEKGISIKQLSFAEVSRGDFVRNVTVQGVVVAANSPTIFSTASGIVQYRVRAGDQVVKGQVLAVMESPELNNQLNQERTRFIELELAVERQRIDGKTIVNQAKQAIDVAKVNLELAEKRMQRAQKSYDSKILSRELFEERNAEYDTAKVNYEHSLLTFESIKEQQDFELKTRQIQLQRQQLTLQNVERQVAELTALSPIDGLIGTISFRDYHQVEENQALLTVIELENYEVEVRIPEIYADELSPMLTSEISINGEKRSAYLAGISPEVVDGQVTGRLRFSGSLIALRQNQRVSAEIFIESKKDVLKLKAGAYLESSNGRFVYVANDEKIIKRTVSFGIRSAGEVEVLSGLQEGEVVVTSNVEQFAQAKHVYLYN